MAGGSGRYRPGICMTTTSSTWQPQDQEAIRLALALPATVPCLDAIGRAIAVL